MNINLIKYVYAFFALLCYGIVYGSFGVDFKDSIQFVNKSSDTKILRNSNIYIVEGTLVKNFQDITFFNSQVETPVNRKKDNKIILKKKIYKNIPTPEEHPKIERHSFFKSSPSSYIFCESSSLKKCFVSSSQYKNKDSLQYHQYIYLQHYILSIPNSKINLVLKDNEYFKIVRVRSPSQIFTKKNTSDDFTHNFKS